MYSLYSATEVTRCQKISDKAKYCQAQPELNMRATFEIMISSEQQGCTTCGSLAARKWRDNKEMERDSLSTLERVADVDDDDYHIVDMMMMSSTGPSLFSTEMSVNEPTGAALPVLHERASGWLVSLFSFWY